MLKVLANLCNGSFWETGIKGLGINNGFEAVGEANKAGAGSYYNATKDTLHIVGLDEETIDSAKNSVMETFLNG